MNRYSRATTWPSRFALYFFAAIVLPASGCDGTPPPTVPSPPVEVDEEQFSNAKFTIKDAPVKDGKFILEKGKEYEFSGSFQLDQIDDEVPGYRETVGYLRAMLFIEFIVDGDKSGFGRGSSNPQTNEVREVTVADDPIKNSSFEPPNIIHFKGKSKAPNYVGESQLRIMSLLPDDPPGGYRFILTRIVEVVDPKAKTGGEK